MAEPFIWYIVSFVVLAGTGFVLPRWFEWRRSLINRLQGEPEEAGHV